MVDVTKQTYGNKIEKSPEFAKEIVITFSDDISVEIMKLFKGNEWTEPLFKELILDWNLTDAKGEKLPISMAGLDMIKSIKLRNWILRTFQDVIVESLSIVKKK